MFTDGIAQAQVEHTVEAMMGVSDLSGSCDRCPHFIQANERAVVCVELGVRADLSLHIMVDVDHAQISHLDGASSASLRIRLL